MLNKITIEYINDYLENNYPDFKLESKKYINSKTPLNFVHSCGYKFTRPWNYMKKGIYCTECSGIKISPNSGKRLSIEDVVNYINSTGCEHVSGDYLNNNSLLTIKCRCGNIFNKSFRNFKSKKQDRCPDCGAKASAQSKVKYTAEYVQEIVNKERGYNIDMSEYTYSYIPVPCTCLNGHRFKLRFDWYLRGQSGCHECQVEFQKGENAPGWKGGSNEVIDNLRKSIKDWKMEVLAYYGFKCSITGEYEENLAVHHLKAFSMIIKECSEKLNIPILRKIKDYENIEDFYNLRNAIINSHNVSNGIVLKRDIHNAFHNEYGKGENTPEQFNEFLTKHYNTSLAQIREDKKSDLYTPRAF